MINTAKGVPQNYSLISYQLPKVKLHFKEKLKRVRYLNLLANILHMAARNNCLISAALVACIDLQNIPSQAYSLMSFILCNTSLHFLIL